MIRFKAILLACLLISTAVAQEKDHHRDSVIHLMDGFIKKANWAAVYDLTDTSFQRMVSKQAFAQQFLSLQQTAWGNYDSLRYARSQNRFSVYKIYFAEFKGMMLVALNQQQQIDAFAIRPYAEPGNDSTIQTNNPRLSLLEKKTDSLVRAHIKRSYTVGMSIGIYEQGVFKFYGYGETIKGNQQIPGNLHLFEIGSISKTFTGWLLAQEVMKGTIHLDSSINRYLPDSIAAMTFNGKAITVKSLSNHTSGIPSLPMNFTVVPGYTVKDPYAGYSREMLFSYLTKFKPFQEPDKQLRYSNMAVGILGNILELKTGLSYEELVRQRIAQPLKMNYTGLTQKQYDGMKNLQTACYDGVGNKASRWHFQAMRAAGSLYSNTTDLLLYAKALTETTQTSTLYQSLELSLQPTSTSNATTKIGLGWFLNTRKGNQYVSHSGGTGGYRSVLIVDRTNKRAVVILNNVANDVTELGFQLMDLINVK
jgi:CubicO group peptidase (beta-lactamase class C family)